MTNLGKTLHNLCISFLFLGSQHASNLFKLCDLPPPRYRTSVRDFGCFTVRQAAEYLGTTLATPYPKIWHREIPFVKLGRAVRFHVKDLETLIEQSKVIQQDFQTIRQSYRGK